MAGAKGNRERSTSYEKHKRSATLLSDVFCFAPAGRSYAGDQLVKKYRYENCAVLALDDGGVMVGAQIATQLHCVLTLLMSEEIKLPQEPDRHGRYNPRRHAGLQSHAIPRVKSTSWRASTTALWSSKN